MRSVVELDRTERMLRYPRRSFSFSTFRLMNTITRAGARFTFPNTWLWSGCITSGIGWSGYLGLPYIFTGTYFVSGPNFTVLNVFPSVHRFGQVRQALFVPYTVPFFFSPWKFITFPIGQVTVPSSCRTKQLVALSYWSSNEMSVFS